MKQFILFILLISTSLAFAQNSKTAELIMTCDAFSITEPFDGAVFQKKIDIFQEPESGAAFAVFKDDTSGNSSLHIGTLKTDASGNSVFESQGSWARIKVTTILLGSGSTLELEYFENGKWVQYPVKPSMCLHIQHGSEGAHN